MNAKVPEVSKFELASSKLIPFCQFGGKYRFKVLYGGRGGAKSWFYALNGVSLSTRAVVRILCCREVLKSMEDSVYQLIIDTIVRLGLEDQFTITKNRITNNYTGSYFSFIGLKNVRSIKSYEGYDICWVEECEAVSAESWELLIPTIRKPKSEFWLSLNPRFTTDYAWAEFIAKERDKSLVCKINYTDNKFCPDVLIDEAKETEKRDIYVYNWVWEGIPMTQGDMCLISDSVVTDAIRRHPEHIDAPKIAGLDVARSLTGDSSAIAIREGNSVTLLKEIKTDNTLVLIDWVKAIHVTEGFQYLFVDAVGVGGGVYDTLKRDLAGVCEVRVFNGGTPARKKQVYKNLRAECWVMLRDFLRDKGSIPDDRGLRTELVSQQYGYDKTTSQIIMMAKDYAKSKGIPSPNKSDAICMTFAPLIETPKPKLENKPKRMGYYG